MEVVDFCGPPRANRRPARSCCTGIRRCLALFWLILPLVPLSAGEPWHFKEDVFRLINRKGPGADEFYAGAGPLPGAPERTAPYVGWQTAPTSIEARLKKDGPEIPAFALAEFTLTVRPDPAVKLRRIVLRLVDRSGEMFQYTCEGTGVFPPEPTRLVYRVDPDLPPANSWGGNKDGKLDWPIRFAGFAVDFAKGNPPGRIYAESLAFRVLESPVVLRLDTGHPLNLLLPGRAAPPEMVLANAGAEPVDFAGTLSLSDVDGPVGVKAVSGQVPAGGEKRIALDGDFSKQGCWRIEGDIANPKTGRRYRSESRFARMDPAGPVPGRRGEAFLFGVCSHAERFSAREGEMEALAAGLCGARIVRLDFDWGRIQPRRGVFEFATFDRLVDVFGKNGVEVQALLGFCAGWAVDKDYRPKNPAVKGRPFPDPRDYAAYCQAVAARYGDRIRYFELWNEPDLVVFANFPGERYMELMRQGYAAVKRAAPDAKVMSGGLASTNTNRSDHESHNRGMMDLLRADGGAHFDVFAFHGHGVYDQYDNILDELETFGLIGTDPSRNWYSNETAISSAEVGEKTQAETLFRKLILAWARGATGYNWYNLREKNYYPPGHRERHFGLVTSEFEPKPAYVAYNMLAKFYGGARFLGRLPLGRGIQASLFQDAEGRGVLALWSDAGDRALLFSGLPRETVALDLYGNPRPVGLDGDLAYLGISPTPFTLLMPVLPGKDFAAVGEAVARALPRQLALEPGHTGELTLSLANPTARPLTLSVAAKTPAGVESGTAEQRITLPPGGKKELPFRFAVGDDFHATPLDPAELRIEITPGNTDPQSHPVFVVRRTSADHAAFRLDQARQYHSLVESAPGNDRYYWRGPDDLSADVALAQRGGKLVLNVTVRDDIHAQPFRGGGVWRGDSVQFALSIPGQDRMWKLGLARLDDGGPEAFCWNAPTGFAGTADRIRLETERNEQTKQTVYAAEIPFDALGLTEEAAANGIRFNLIVNDNDGDRRKGFLAIAPGLGVVDEDSRHPMVGLAADSGRPTDGK